MDSLEQLEHLSAILELQRFLVETFSGRIALSDIENMTIHEICSKIDESYQEKFVHLCSVLLRTLKESSDSSKTSLNRGLKESVKDEIPEISVKSIPTKPIGQGRKIRKTHSGCDSIWMHYEHKKIHINMGRRTDIRYGA